jgi:hypothetical protein
LYLKRSNNIRDELQKSDLTDNSIDEELISLNKYIFLKKKRKNAVNAEENNIQFDENNFFISNILD